MRPSAVLGLADDLDPGQRREHLVERRRLGARERREAQDARISLNSSEARGFLFESECRSISRASAAGSAGCSETRVRERLDAPRESRPPAAPARRSPSPAEAGLPGGLPAARAAALKNFGGPSLRTMRPEASLAIQISWLEVCRARTSLAVARSADPLANARPLTYQYWPGPITGAGSPATSLAACSSCARGGRGLLVADAEADEERAAATATRTGAGEAASRRGAADAPRRSVRRGRPRAGRRGWPRGRVGSVRS